MSAQQCKNCGGAHQGADCNYGSGSADSPICLDSPLFETGSSSGKKAGFFSKMTFASAKNKAASVQARQQKPAASVEVQQQKPAASVQVQQQKPAASLQVPQQKPAASVQTRHQFSAASVLTRQQKPAPFDFHGPDAPPRVYGYVNRPEWGYTCLIKDCGRRFQKDQDRFEHTKAYHPRCPVYGCHAGPFKDDRDLRNHRESAHSGTPVQYIPGQYYNRLTQFVRAGMLHTRRGHPFGENTQENDHLYSAPVGETEEEKKVRHAKLNALAKESERMARLGEINGHARRKSD